MKYPLPDRFELLEERERTGSKVLLRAWDKTLEREVVIQLLGAIARRHSNQREQLREARMMGRVQHPGVCRLLEVLETEAGAAMVLEPLVGETLAERLERTKPLDPAEVRRIGIAVAEALAAVHTEGVVHRGVSENNIVFRPDDSIVLAGFEFSKPLAGIPQQSSLDYRGARDALPAYPAPEQLKGEKANVRTDVFSLGCVLYHALTGHTPLAQHGLLVHWTPPEDPAELAPDAPADLLDAIRKCVAESPLRRFSNMAELVTALGGSVAEPVRTAPALVRSRWLAMAASVVVLAGAGLAARQWLRAPPETDEIRGILLDQIATTSGWSESYESSRALLIGIDYRGNDAFRQLSNAERDVRALADRLRKLGWQDVVELIGEQATHDRIDRALEDLEERAGKNDQVFIYFAGHGEIPELDEGVEARSGFALPADAGARPESRRRKGPNWLEFSRFDSFFEESDVKHILIALDCCHSGGAGWDVPRGTDPRTREFSRRYLSRKAHVLLASSRPNEVAYDGEGQHSPFASAVLACLDEAYTGRPVTTTKIWSAVQDSLRDQVPEMFWRPGATSQFVFLPPAPPQDQP